MSNELLDYMPDYYNGVYEMEELLKAEDITFSGINDDIERTLLNQFIIKADEQGISVFEDEAGIKPNPGDSLETRRNNVLLHLLPPKPLTIRYLNHLFGIMGLKVKAKVDIANRTVIVEASSEDVDAEKVKSVQYMLNICIPANMLYSIRVSMVKAQVQRELYFGVVNTADTSITIPANTGQLNFRHDLTTNLYLGIGTNTITSTTINADEDQLKE